MTGKVTERAKSLIPIQRSGENDICMVCRRSMRPGRVVRGEGRVCSPACAKSWAQGQK